MNSIVAPTRYVSTGFLTVAIALSLATGTLVGFALSQPPTPRIGENKNRPASQQPEPTETKPNPDPRGTNTNPLFVRSIRSQDQTAENQQERRDQQANRRYTLWLGIGTLIVIALQVWLLFRQNSIMDEQTSTMNGQLTAATTAANAAKLSADTAHAALIADQRPWLSLGVVPNGPITRETDPRAARHDWHLHIRCTIRNLGKTPATYVQVNPKLIPLTGGYFTGGVKDGIPQGTMIEGTNVAREAEQACRSVDRNIRDQARALGMGFGHVVFPGEDYSVTWRIPFPGEETPEPPMYMGHFVLAIGVTYNSTFNNPDDFKTGEAFNVWKRIGDQRLRFNGEDVSLEAIGFIRYPFGSGSLAS